MSLGIGLYIIPLAMIANPNLIELGSRPGGAVLAAAQIGLGLGLISVALIGAFRGLLRPFFAVLGAALIFLPRVLGVT